MLLIQYRYVKYGTSILVKTFVTIMYLLLVMLIFQGYIVVATHLLPIAERSSLLSSPASRNVLNTSAAITRAHKWQ
jgi:hypothetical protein